MSIERAVLVTGASGFLGRHIVHRLAGEGVKVRALVRQTSRTEAIAIPGVELVYGDVTDADSLNPSFEGIDCVIHAAAGTSGSDEMMRRVTIDGTRNVLNLCRRHCIGRLIYISSCSVYAVADCPPGSRLDESSPLEPHPERRGNYSWTKLDAENLIRDAIDDAELDIVCLRPGTIYGPGGENFTPMLGFSKGRFFIVIDNKEFILPLVYVDNLVDAISTAMRTPGAAGGVYNVVDSEPVGKQRYMNLLVPRLYSGARVVYFPYVLLATLVRFQEILFRLLRRKPLLTRYRLQSSQNAVIYNAARISHELGWKQRVVFSEAVEKIVAG
jgi:nucleoside-diphosphate-sugar epimerase